MSFSVLKGDDATVLIPIDNRNLITAFALDSDSLPHEVNVFDVGPSPDDDDVTICRCIDSPLNGGIIIRDIDGGGKGEAGQSEERGDDDAESRRAHTDYILDHGVSFLHGCSREEASRLAEDKEPLD